MLDLKYNNEEKLKNRLPILLDTNIWIDLAEKQTDIIKRTKKLLIDLTNNGKIFCPLTSDVFMEFHKQSIDSINRLTPLIDNISLNLSLTDCNNIYKLEIEKALQNTILGIEQNIDLNNLFVPYVCTNSRGKIITIPNSPDENFTKFYFRKLNEHLINWKFSDYIGHFENILPQHMNLGNYNFQEEFLERYKRCEGNKKHMKNREQNYFIKEIMTPIVLKYLDELLNRNKSENEKKKIRDVILILNEEINDNKNNLFYEIIDNSPLIKNTIEIMTFSGFDLNRKSKENDIYDYNIMIEAMSYFGVLFSKDKWMTSLLKNNINNLMTKTKIISSFEEFHEFLYSIN
ncbi:MAG: hypothetical protein PHN88_13925 [Ignavibacteria bacterium]|nr:hypothetical protein [Ignavibacteria bacterium]